MKPFAKLFESEDYGQILVVIDSNEEDRPEIKISFQPEGLGICHMGLKYKDDSDEEWDKAEKAFQEMTFEQAESVVGRIINSTYNPAFNPK